MISKCHLSVHLSVHPSLFVHPSLRATTNACVAVGSRLHSTAHVQGHGLLSGRGCLREMMTAQDVLAVCLLCRLVVKGPRRAPLLSPPRQHRMAARVSEEHSMLETLRPRVCWPRVRSDPTARSRGKQFHRLRCPMLLAALCSSAFRFAPRSPVGYRFARRSSVGYRFARKRSRRNRGRGQMFRFLSQYYHISAQKFRNCPSEESAVAVRKSCAGVL